MNVVVIVHCYGHCFSREKYAFFSINLIYSPSTSLDFIILESTLRLYPAYLYSSRSFLGVPLQQVPHQGDCFVAGIRDEGLQVGRHTLGEAEVHSRSQLVTLWPIRLKGETMTRLFITVFIDQVNRFSDHQIFEDFILVHIST